MSGRHLLELAYGNIAHSDKTDSSSLTLFAHRLPDLGISIAPIVGQRGTMQYIAIDIVCPKMFERTATNTAAGQWTSSDIEPQVVET